MRSKYGLMEVFGIELEYMVVDAATLSVKSIVDELFAGVTGKIQNVVERERVDWSNELVAHVCEFKNKRPEPDISDLEESFQSEIDFVNKKLETFGAMLMPTAMHPLMNPDIETRLWPHSQNEIYRSYDRIFGCKGHGWSNLQSLHINISFSNDDEFRKLHSAIRIILPLIPALSSSSPIVEGRYTGLKSSRLSYYLENQRRIPSIIGHAIPEYVESEQEYVRNILEPMYRDIAPLDTAGVLQEEWLNSRGAIPKFERGCIEIRLADVQESVVVDLSVAYFWTTLIRMIIEGGLIDIDATKKIDEADLQKILAANVRSGEFAEVTDLSFLALFQFRSRMTSRELLSHLCSKAIEHSSNNLSLGYVARIVEKGTLSTRIENAVGPNPEKERIVEVYRELCRCLSEGEFFDP
ncbi:MAG: glutamate-cysteine ligase family protein [Planctomycetes bacterium]|nr:glutamate-cysteine ligase family protein [Planctomycetota bacterium]